jgi:hypothetical protein
VVSGIGVPADKWYHTSAEKATGENQNNIFNRRDDIFSEEE